MSDSMQVEVNVLGKEYHYTTEDKKISIYVKTQGSRVTDISIFVDDERFKDYFIHNIDVPIELLDVLAEALKDLKKREGL